MYRTKLKEDKSFMYEEYKNHLIEGVSIVVILIG